MIFGDQIGVKYNELYHLARCLSACSLPLRSSSSLNSIGHDADEEEEAAQRLDSVKGHKIRDFGAFLALQLQC